MSLMAFSVAIGTAVTSKASEDVLVIAAGWGTSSSCVSDTADDDCSTSNEGERCLTKRDNQPANDTVCNNELRHAEVD